MIDLEKKPVFPASGGGKISSIRYVAEFILELVRIVIISLVIIIPVRYFLIQPFYVKGASMEPNFHDNEYLVVDEISYRFKNPHRGDIVVFKYPRDPRQYFIKRVIGLPGEKVEVKGGSVYVDGVLLDESLYIDKGIKTNKEDIWILKDNEFFMMGDNRVHSMDSREFGPVKRPFIVGRTWIRGWPLDKLTVFETPSYNLY